MKDMFLGATPSIFDKATELRNNLTHAEVLLWDYLRTSPLGYKFRRQHPMDIFIVDFYCHKLKLVIEVDGGIHNAIAVNKDDKVRQRYLEGEGMTFLRFTNEEIENELGKVIERIEQHIQPPIPKGA